MLQPLRRVLCASGTRVGFYARSVDRTTMNLDCDNKCQRTDYDQPSIQRTGRFSL